MSEDKDKFVIKINVELEEESVENITNQIWERLQDKIDKYVETVSGNKINRLSNNINGLADAIKNKLPDLLDTSPAKGDIIRETFRQI